MPVFKPENDMGIKDSYIGGYYPKQLNLKNTNKTSDVRLVGKHSQQTQVEYQPYIW